VIQQELDYQGKLRILQFDNGICVMTNPLPPLRVPQKKCSYKSVPIQDAQSFLRYEGISIETTKDHIVSGRQVGIHASKDGVDFYIPIVHIEKDFDNEIDVITPIMDTDRSELESYNDYSRRARYLIEYMYYLFSLDYQTYNPEKIDSEYILSFVDRNIEINSEFQYGDVPRMFSLDSGLLQDNKLVVQNTFTLKKLLYCLRLKLRDNSEELKKYSEYKYIKEYYKDIRDFSSTDTQPILYGKDSLKKWIDNIKPNYTLYESIKLQESSLYKELSKYDNDKPFMLVFTAKWHRPCKNLLSKLSPTISGDKRDLFRLYGKRIHFVYIDIEENKSIVTNYDINSIPFILFLKISAAKLVEIGRIVGTDNTNQNLKMIETKISEILKI
jgi:thiol-disulfide isomerase/thioredoxin